MINKKVFVFDFDGTFYSGEQAFSKVAAYVNKHKREFLPNVSDSEYNKIVKDHPTWKTVVDGAPLVDMIYLFKKEYPHLNISVQDFWKWQQSKPDPIVIDPNQVVNPEFIKQLCEKYPVYIVSNSSPNHINFYMNKLNINPKWFKKIISNKFTAKDRTKKHYYKHILDIENCLPCNAFVFGDSIKNDLEPAISLGINNYHVTDANQIPFLVNKEFQKKDSI